MSFFGNLLILALVIIVAFVGLTFLNARSFGTGFADFLSNIKFPDFRNKKDQQDSQVAKQEAIERAEENLEQQAIDEGFDLNRGLTASQERALATDSGSIVVGSTNNTIDFGLIGDKLPTDPSPEFIANANRLLTPDQLRRFNEQQRKKNQKSLFQPVNDFFDSIFNPDKKEKIAKEGNSKDRDPEIPINLDQVIFDSQTVSIGPPKPARGSGGRRFD